MIFLTRIVFFVLIAFVLLGLTDLLGPEAIAQEVLPIPRINIDIGNERADDPGQVALALQIIFFLTILVLAPAIVLMLTSFTRIIIVLEFARRALTTQQVPPQQVLVGLALFLTFFIMTPVIREINDLSFQPFLTSEIDQQEALSRAQGPIREFMFKQTRPKDMALFVRLSGIPRPVNEDDIPTYVLIPSFMISELTKAFLMGIVLFVPFIVIDIIVASVLLSLGIIVLPPVLISFPIKLLIFVLADGWNLLIGSMVQSFVR